MMAEDRMAHEKLAEGIQGFTKAIETLEAQLAIALPCWKEALLLPMPPKRSSS